MHENFEKVLLTCRFQKGCSKNFSEIFETSSLSSEKPLSQPIVSVRPRQNFRKAPGTHPLDGQLAAGAFLQVELGVVGLADRLPVVLPEVVLLDRLLALDAHEVLRMVLLLEGGQHLFAPISRINKQTNRFCARCGAIFATAGRRPAALTLPSMGFLQVAQSLCKKKIKLNGTPPKLFETPPPPPASPFRFRASRQREILRELFWRAGFGRLGNRPSGPAAISARQSIRSIPGGESGEDGEGPRGRDEGGTGGRRWRRRRRGARRGAAGRGRGGEGRQEGPRQVSWKGAVEVWEG